MAYNWTGLNRSSCHNHWQYSDWFPTFVVGVVGKPTSHVGAEAGHCQWSLGIQSAAKASASTCLYITLIPPCCLDVSGAPKELVLQHAAQDWSRVVSLSLLSSNRHGHSQWFHNWYSGSGWWKVPSLISKLCRFLARLFRSLVMLAGAQKSYRHKQVRSGQSQAEVMVTHDIFHKPIRKCDRHWFG
jgi:hypothetical protein